jgi:hypothetical protein
MFVTRCLKFCESEIRIFFFEIVLKFPLAAVFEN